jgi:hypothetical protein
VQFIEHEADGESIVVGLVNLWAVDEASVEVGLVVRDDWQRRLRASPSKRALAPGSGVRARG